MAHRHRAMTMLVAAMWANTGVPRPGLENQRPRDVSDAATTPPPVVWRVAAEGQGTPAVRDGCVYFLTRRHELVAVDVDSGYVRWRSATGTDGPATIGTGVRATADIVVAGDETLVAFDARDGRLRWRFALPEGYGAGLYLGTLSDSTVYAGSPAGRMYAVELATGLARWTKAIWPDGPATIYTPTTAGKDVVATYTRFGHPSAGGIVVLDAATGNERWRRDFPRDDTSATGGAAGGPVVAGSLVIASNRDGIIWAFDRDTGVGRWSLPPVIGQDFRALVSSGNTLVASSLSGIVAAYDLSTRQERWRRAPSETSVAFGMTTDSRSVYVPYLSGELIALDLATGEERWRTDSGTPGMNWVPQIVDGRLYASSSTALLAFQP